MLAGAGVAAGIIAGDSGGGLIILFTVVFLIFVYKAYKTAAKQNLKNKRLAIIFLIVLSFLTGIFRIRDTKSLDLSSVFPDKGLKNSVVTGRISDISFGKEQYIIILDNPQIELKESDDKMPLGMVMVYSDSYVGKPGDIVYAGGTLYSFSPATNYGQFDQREYYLSKGIVLKLYADECRLVTQNKSITGLVKGFLLDLSVDFQRGIGQVFDEKDSGILYAMLAGNRSELDDSTKGMYQRMGIAHVLSISGLHITLIGLGLFKILMLLTKRLKFSVAEACIFIFLYGILTGFSVSTTRAVIMLCCMLFAKLLGEAYDGQSAAGFAAVIILILNPLELYEAGFQLSFIAVFGIFAGNEIRKNLKIKSPVLIYLLPALSAQIATFPIILSSYYSFSPYSIIANIILLPFMPVIVVSGFAAGIFGTMALTIESGTLLSIARIMAGPAHYMLKGYESVSAFLQGMPGADIITGCPKLWKIIVYYLALFILIAYSRVLKSAQINRTPVSNRIKCSRIKCSLMKYGIIFLISVIAISCLIIYRGKADGLKVSFIDVGQGLSMYIEADGKHILADGGSSNVKNVGKYRIEPFLLWSGVDEIDFLLISHTDEDHISGIRELIEEGRIRIDNLVTGINYDDSEPIIALAKEKGINVIKAEAGNIIGNNADLFSDKEEHNIDEEPDTKAEQYDGLLMRVLSPDSGFIYEDKNQASLVMELKYKGLSMLFTGDSDIYAESEYVRYLGGERINILQCPHHGSKYSSSELLLSTITPDVTVISCSKNNVYGHPAHETLDRLEEAGSRYYVTYETGIVTISYEGDETFKVLTFINKN